MDRPLLEEVSCTGSITLASIFLELFPFANFFKKPGQVTHVFRRTPNSSLYVWHLWNIMSEVKKTTILLKDHDLFCKWSKCHYIDQWIAGTLHHGPVASPGPVFTKKPKLRIRLRIKLINCNYMDLIKHIVLMKFWPY